MHGRDDPCFAVFYCAIRVRLAAGIFRCRQSASCFPLFPILSLSVQMAVLFFSPTTFTSSLSNPKPYNPPRSFNPTCSNLHRPSSHPVRISRSHPHIRLQIAHHMLLAPKCTLRPSMAAGLEDMNSELPSESELPLESEPVSSSHTEASFDIKLPRRSLLVQFTCNACGERTQRTINRAAYERGTVFVQCAGCLQHHKLVDNLGLVVEYDLREDSDSDTNQV